MHSDLKSIKEQKSTLRIKLQKQKEKVNTIEKSQVKHARTLNYSLEQKIAMVGFQKTQPDQFDRVIIVIIRS